MSHDLQLIYIITSLELADNTVLITAPGYIPIDIPQEINGFRIKIKMRGEYVQYEFSRTSSAE